DELPASHSRPQHARHRFTVVRVLERGRGDVNCDQLFWAVNVGFGSHDRVKTGKTQNRKWFPVLPPRADLPPDLRTTPAASASRTPPSRPRASARSRRSACGPHGAGREKPKPIQNNSGLPQGFAGPCAVG